MGLWLGLFNGMAGFETISEEGLLMTPEEELAKIREPEGDIARMRLTHWRTCDGYCSYCGGNEGPYVEWPCDAMKALTLAAQLAREHARSGCGGGCGDIIARKIEGKNG